MRHRTLSLLLAPALLALAAGCASPPKVYVQQDPRADFGAYRTYGFVEELGTDGAGYGSLLSQFLKEAAARELEARGYRPSAEPDLLVNFFVRTKEKISTTTTPTGYYGYRGYDPWWGAGHETTVTQFTEGTLNVDLVDRARGQLVWEGVLVGRVREEHREKLRETVDRAIAELFGRYPYVAGSGAPAE
jgi:hypothetical protein